MATMSKNTADHARDIFNIVVEEKFDGKQSAFAAALGVAQPTLSKFMAGKAGFGPKLLEGLFRIDPDRAQQIVTGPSDNASVISRYPNKDIAIEYLARSGLSRTEVTRGADALAIALDAHDDPTPEWWAQRIQESINTQRKGSRLGVRTATEDDF